MMIKLKIIGLWFILLVTTSCQKEEQVPRVIFPEGFFLVDNNLYFSDGSRFYCTFKDWDHLYSLRGNKAKPKSNIIKQSELPSGMRFIQYCNSGILTPKFYQ